MELTWSTFVLEIVNFLVLIWILKRFLYKPVTDVIARRRAAIDKTLADAKALNDEATELQQRYEGRLTDWEEERRSARESMTREVEAERTRRLDALNKELDAERERARTAEQRRQDEARRRMEETAAMQGARFAGRLLERAASADLEARLVDLAMEWLGALDDDALAAIRDGYQQAPEPVTVTTAYPLDEARRQQLTDALNHALEATATVDFAEDSALIAGLHVTVGAWVLKANLRDELAGFAAIATGVGQP